VSSLAVSQDGKYLAALLRYSSNYLEVFNREDKSVVYSGLDIVSGGGGMVWTPKNELVVVLSLSKDDNPERWGAIAVIPLERLYAATNATIDIDLYATFNRTDWGLSGVEDIAISSDGT
jgi:hypothetical protein